MPQEEIPPSTSTTTTSTIPPEVPEDIPVFNEQAYQHMMDQLTSVFPISGKLKKRQKQLPSGDTFSRTDLVLTLPQLIKENYPLPIPSNALSKICFIPTATSYSPVNPHSPLFSIDCEMCCTASDPQALTKIAVINESLQVVYETLVQPPEPITDYLTRWSGITAEMLKGVTVTLADVQQRLQKLVEDHPDCIFVGQSLNCDLKAIKITHPYVIDTSCIFNLTGVDGRKNSLRDLSYNLLDQKIQVQGNWRNPNKPVGHCPVEDASAALKLVKAKLEQG